MCAGCCARWTTSARVPCASALASSVNPFALPPSRRHDELGELASTINTMGHDIEQMLEAQRALLLAISHELRSPLTRARLNTELLPDTAEVAPQRDALLRDLAEMARLISDLLESERLAGRHAALHREPTDPAATGPRRDRRTRHHRSPPRTASGCTPHRTCRRCHSIASA